MQPTGREGRQLRVEFEERGFLVIPDILSQDQLSAINRSIEHYLEVYPDHWVKFSESLIQTGNVLPDVSDFDFAIENPKALEVLLSLIGEKITFEEFSIMLRNPTDQVQDMKGWHRDLTRDYSRRKEIDAVSLVYYLTDVTESDHCFSIIPETHNRLVDLKPQDVAPGMEFDVTGPAGTALIFHARCLHSGKLKPKSRQRRTLHLYYARSDQPRTSEWSDIPERLYRKVDPALPRGLYSKWNVTEVFEGTGRKPRDLDPSMSTAEMVREVQRRANQVAGK
jgi:ectoine hydroxylase-related dioxygenase (phytanoyl-CoA dioxygenase family)